MKNIANNYNICYNSVYRVTVKHPLHASRMEGAAMSRRRRKTFCLNVVAPRSDPTRPGCTYVWVHSYMAFSHELVTKLTYLPDVYLRIARQRRSILVSVPDWFWQDHKDEILRELAADIAHPWELNPRGYRVKVTERQRSAGPRISIMNDGRTLRIVRS